MDLFGFGDSLNLGVEVTEAADLYDKGENDAKIQFSVGVKLFPHGYKRNTC